MKENQLTTITKLFEGKEIRSIWDKDKEDYYFSVVDVINALVEPKDASDYWTTLKRRLKIDEGSELPTNCRKLKMIAQDGKYRLTDTLDTEGIFRLIESVPSPKAEPFKLWLAKLGREEIDNIFDPSKGIDKMIKFYLMKGYDLKWIESRIRSILDRQELTDAWKENGIKDESDFAYLTNVMYKEWSGMNAKEYKEFKGLRKESLRDNMDNLELILTDLSEEATKRLAKKERPTGLKENAKVAKKGGKIAKNTRNNLEEELGEDIVSSSNKIDYEYDDSIGIEMK